MVASHRAQASRTPQRGHVVALLVCATPIGNLADVTLRVLDCLRAADLVICEDTRQSAKLLRRYEIEAELVSLDRHHERERIPSLLARLDGGRDPGAHKRRWSARPSTTQAPGSSPRPGVAAMMSRSCPARARPRQRSSQAVWSASATRSSASCRAASKSVRRSGSRRAAGRGRWLHSNRRDGSLRVSPASPPPIRPGRSPSVAS